MLSPSALAGVKIKENVFADTSHLHAVASAAGATNVPMEQPPAKGWPDSTCVAVIAAIESKARDHACELRYPFFVGDVACRHVVDYKTLRAVARACVDWNLFVDELIAAKENASPYLRGLAQTLETTWSKIDLTTAAATSTALAAICGGALMRVEAIKAWRATAMYMAGEMVPLHTALVSPILVDREHLIKIAANKSINTHLDTAIAALNGTTQREGALIIYTDNVLAAMAYGEHAGQLAKDNERLQFHTDAMARAKINVVPPSIKSTVSQAIVGWTTKQSI